MKTKKYVVNQTCFFDDGTRGVAGSKLLIGNTAPSWRPSFVASAPSSSAKDADGDTIMTGVNKIRAKFVSKAKLDRRRAEGDYIRCGNKNHIISNCPYLPPKRNETAVNKATSFEEMHEESRGFDETSETLKA